MPKTIAYISTYTGMKENLLSDLKRICSKAKETNPTIDITGVLFYHNRRFMQVLEGERSALEFLMQKLMKDPRHSQLVRMVDIQVNSRGFGDWNMDTFNLDIDQQIDLNLVQQCVDLFDANRAVNGSHFVKAVKSILHYGQTKKFMVI